MSLISKERSQKDIRLGTHGEDYGSWMSNPVFYMVGGPFARKTPPARAWIPSVFFSMAMPIIWTSRMNLLTLW